MRAENVPLRDICGMIGLAGPYDFRPVKAQELKDIFAPTKELAQTQPINFVDANEPPRLLMTGKSDTTVRPTNSINLAGRVREAGGRAQLIEYADRRHVGLLLALAMPFRRIAPVLKNATDFMRKKCASHTSKLRRRPASFDTPTPGR
jgi:dipeptidyl aminopeptidase/acylaminoacyl peptidase